MSNESENKDMNKERALGKRRGWRVLVKLRKELSKAGVAVNGDDGYAMFEEASTNNDQQMIEESSLVNQLHQVQMGTAIATIDALDFLNFLQHRGFIHLWEEYLDEDGKKWEGREPRTNWPTFI